MPIPSYVTLCTAPVGQAEELASVLVERRLAACVNIVGGVQSVYRWEGEVTKDSESLLIIKTTRGTLTKMQEELVRSHPYDVPEVISFEIDSGYAPYLDWIRASVG